MATEEELVKVIESFHMNMPKHFMTKVDKTHAGMGQVMFYLEQIDRPICAGEISEFMNVSTARVAVLLRGMEKKKWILRVNDPDDARKTIIILTDGGREQIKKARREFEGTVAAIIDRVGFDRMTAFFETAREINEVISEHALAAQCDGENMPFARDKNK